MPLLRLLLTSPMVPLIASLLLPFLYYLLILRPKSNGSIKEAPEPAGAWPIIGHLHLLSKRVDLPHIILAKLAESYGPIFRIRLGVRQALVVSNWEVAMECLATNDKVFATRPSSLAVKLMGYDYAFFPFTPYGAYWRELRKIVTLELLSNHRLHLLNHVWASEIDTSIKELYQSWANNHAKNKSPRESPTSGPVLVEMKQWFSDLMLNVAVRLVVGKRFIGISDGYAKQEENTRRERAMREWVRLMGLFVVSDALPFLGWLDLQGCKKQMKHTAKELDVMLQEWLDEHRMKRQPGGANEDQDFMDVMLSTLQESMMGKYDENTIIKATSLSMIMGSSDTTLVALTWALSLLMNNPCVLKKAQDELDFHVGRDKHVNQSDIKNLIYLQAIIKEALRLYPPGPLLAPHESLEDCTISGYTVRKGTRLIVNVRKIQRDPQVWPDPLEFRPERFLTRSNADVDVMGHHFQLIPFGSGRRSCPGKALGLQIVQLTLARTLQGFELATESGIPVDMTENPGIANHKATPLEVLITPRLPSKLYVD